MAWVREGDSPEVVKVSFNVYAKDNPELAQFIWNLPFRSTSKILRDLLDESVKKKLRKQGNQAKEQAPSATRPQKETVEFDESEAKDSQPPSTNTNSTELKTDSLPSNDMRIDSDTADAIRLLNDSFS